MIIHREKTLDQTNIIYPFRESLNGIVGEDLRTLSRIIWKEQLTEHPLIVATG